MPAGGAAEKEEFDAEGFNAEVQAHAGRCEHFDFKTLHVIQHLLATGDPEDIVKLDANENPYGPPPGTFRVFLSHPPRSLSELKLSMRVCALLRPCRGGGSLGES